MDYQAEIDRLRELQDKERAALRSRKWTEWRNLVSCPDNWIWEATGLEVVKANPFTKYAGRPALPRFAPLRRGFLFSLTERKKS